MKRERGITLIALVITLLIVLIVTIVTCTYFLLKTMKEQKPSQKVSVPEVIETTPTPKANIYTFNETGKNLIADISFIEIVNCRNTIGDCGSTCDGSNSTKIENLNKIKEIISHIQTGKVLSEMPKTDTPMGFCGGVKIDFYYTDDTYTSLWFSTRSIASVHIKAPTSGGVWKQIQYYQYETESLYNYLTDLTNQA